MILLDGATLNWWFKFLLSSFLHESYTNTYAKRVNRSNFCPSSSLLRFICQNKRWGDQDLNHHPPEFLQLHKPTGPRCPAIFVLTYISGIEMELMFNRIFLFVTISHRLHDVTNPWNHIYLNIYPIHNLNKTCLQQFHDCGKVFKFCMYEFILVFNIFSIQILKIIKTYLRDP